MKTRQLKEPVIDIEHSRFDSIIERLVIALLAFMPFAFGAVEAWSEEVVLFLAAAISVCFLCKLVFIVKMPYGRNDAAFVWTWAYVPVVLLIFIVVFQMVPLPTGLVALISPNTAAIKSGLLGDLPDVLDQGGSRPLSSMTLSFYPHATKHDLRLLLAVAAVFVVVINVYRTVEQIKRVLAAIAVIGGVVAALALAQDIFGNGKIYWIVPTGHGYEHAGPFINHGHFGQFMNLSIGAAMGLIMVRLQEVFGGRKVTPSLVADYFNSSQAKVIWALVIIIVLGAAAEFVSLTRGGMISMLMAIVFTTLVLSSRKASLAVRGWIMVLMALGALVCVLYMGFDAVYDRLEMLGKLHEAQDGRWQIVKDIAAAWTKFPVFGTGFGTHEVVYPMFDRSTILALAAYAENEYAQAAEEIGAAGLVLLAAFCAIILANFVRVVIHGFVPISSAAFGLGFGLVALVIQSLSDFGQHLPANAFLSAVSCALLIVLARNKQSNHCVLEAAKIVYLPRVLRIAVLVLFSGVWTWVLAGTDRSRVAELYWRYALVVEDSLMQKNWQGADDEFKSLIYHAAAAAYYEPENVKHSYWLNVYRWRSISRVTDPNTGEVIIPEQMIGFVPRIVGELHKTRRLCPVFGPAYSMAGQLEKFVLNDESGAQHILTGYRLAPCDPAACFAAGLLDAAEGRIEESYAKFKRAVQLDGKLFADVVDVYINRFGRADLAVTIAGDSIDWLSHVANVLSQVEDRQELVSQARAMVLETLETRCFGPDAPAWALASLGNIYGRENDYEAAIQCYRRALALDYSQVNWRLTLARLLTEANRISEAAHEARICLRLRPQFTVAEELIADLSILSRAATEENRVTWSP